MPLYLSPSALSCVAFSCDKHQGRIASTTITSEGEVVARWCSACWAAFECKLDVARAMSRSGVPDRIVLRWIERL